MKLSPDTLEELAALAADTAEAAGRLIAEHRDREIDVAYKASGDSRASQVVTKVDQKSEALILKALLPSCNAYDLALLTEESEDDRQRLSKDYFWCVDPMDGTLAFVESDAGFAVSIALVARDGTPMIGVAYDPVSETLYRAVKDQGALRDGNPWANDQGDTLTLHADAGYTQHPSFDHTMDQLVKLATRLGYTGVTLGAHGGAVMNACWALDHAPACFFKRPKPQTGGGCLWDYAATACLYRERGAIATDMQGESLRLNRSDTLFMNDCGVLYATDAAIAEGLRSIDRE